MGKMKKIISLLILLLTASSCFARQISIQIVQHDDGIEEVSEQSLIVEDNLLNGFFDEGYIVTNSPAEISSSDNQDEEYLKKGLGEAFNGFADYFIQIKLYFVREGSAYTNNANLDKVDWIVASAKTGVTVQNSSIKNKYNHNKAEDLGNISLDLLAEIKKALKA